MPHFRQPRINRLSQVFSLMVRKKRSSLQLQQPRANLSVKRRHSYNDNTGCVYPNNVIHDTHYDQPDSFTGADGRQGHHRGAGLNPSLLAGTPSGAGGNNDRRYRNTAWYTNVQTGSSDWRCILSCTVHKAAAVQRTPPEIRLQGGLRYLYSKRMA